jgi:hypothetical protein
MPRGSTDLTAFLASRSQQPVEVCDRLVRRGTAAGAADGEKQPAARDLMVLKELSAAYAAATARDD